MAVKFRRGAWYADFYDGHGTRRQIRFRTKDGAEVAEARGTLEAQQKIVPVVDPGITFEAYSKRWLEECKARDLKPGTIERCESALRLHLLPRLGRQRIRSITRPLVKAALQDKLVDEDGSQQGVRPGRNQKRAQKPLARGSVRHLLAVLMGVMSSAVEDQIITANPLRGMGKKLRLTNSRRGQKVKALDVAQLRLFLTAARDKTPEHYPILATMAWAGLRIGEALAITEEKVNLSARSILVDAQIKGTTKTEAQRNVDVSGHLASVLSATIEWRRRPSSRIVSINATNATVNPTAPTIGPWLFYPEMGPAPGRKAEARTVKTVRRAMARVLKFAGLPQHFTPHSLRHSFGSQLIAAGVSPAYVQQQMGHASIQMTVDIYGSWLPIRVAGAVDGLSAATAPDGSVGDMLVTNGALQAQEGRTAEHA